MRAGIELTLIGINYCLMKVGGRCRDGYRVAALIGYLVSVSI